ncbi:beta/gamma crystallin domain-containing protein [Streptomyces sp. NPDC085946]|uniref:beta/gamma crystallin domain-containing protein n=1 Tax=Streptomyces sp. NPDC085946 TaxID=3365744 RepID=UPI0037CE54FE
MHQTAKRAALAALTTVSLTASLMAATATNASAIDIVPCGNHEYLHVTAHLGSTTRDENFCYANAGQHSVGGVQDYWVTRIWTGNNRVQWYGDGRWQPEQPIGKYTEMTWPNHPGGVRAYRIRIL